MTYEREETAIIMEPDTDMQILVVEDNNLVSDYLKSIILRHFSPCRTTVVNSIAGCMACLQEKKFHLILLDSTLELKPEDSCSAIRDLETTTPIILMVVSETKITQEYVIGCGADGIIYKPIEVEYLLKEIKRVIHSDLDQRGVGSGFFKVVHPD